MKDTALEVLSKVFSKLESLSAAGVSHEDITTALNEDNELGQHTYTVTEVISLLHFLEDCSSRGLITEQQCQALIQDTHI
jgi:hypothetical protein